MDPYKVLKIGYKYSKAQLSENLKQPTISSVREGKFRCKNSNSYLLFVDLEKSDKEDKRFHFNDFFEGDLLYINKQDGTFEESSKEFLSHTSQFSMGNDIVDINHDGFPEIFSLDMLPEKEEILNLSKLNCQN